MDNPSPEVDINTRVGQYVKLRDKIRELEDSYKKTLKPYTEALDILGNILLEHLNAQKVESVRAENGTFFKSTKKSASLEDPDTFMKFIIANKLWDLIDRRANVTGVVDYLKTNEALPPGVKYSEYETVNVRRPT